MKKAKETSFEAAGAVRFLFLMALILMSLSFRQADAARPKIAVLPFEDGSLKKWWSGDFRPGEGIAESFVTELVKSGVFTVIERSQLKKVLEEQGLGGSGILDAAAASRIGKIAGVRYLIAGKVTEFSISETSAGVGSLLNLFGSTNTSLNTLDTKTRKARVAIDARLINTDSAAIEFAEKGIGEETSASTSMAGQSFGMTEFRESILGKATDKAIMSLLRKFVDAVKVEPEGKVVDVEQGIVTINMGEGEVTVGQRMAIFSRGKTLQDPDTGEILEVELNEIGLMQIVSVSNKISRGTIVERTGNPRPGDIVKPSRSGAVAESGMKSSPEKKEPRPVSPGTAAPVRQEESTLEKLSKEYNAIKMDSEKVPEEKKKALENLRKKIPDGNEYGALKEDIKKEIEYLENRIIWADWLNRFLKGVQAVENAKNMPPEERKKAYENLLAQYGDDDPHSEEDEKLRDDLKGRTELLGNQCIWYNWLNSFKAEFSVYKAKKTHSPAEKKKILEALLKKYCDDDPYTDEDDKIRAEMKYILNPAAAKIEASQALKQEEEARAKALEEKRVQEEARKKALEEKRVKEEEARAKALEEKRVQEEARKKALEEKRVKEEEARAKALEEKRIREESFKSLKTAYNSLKTDKKLSLPLKKSGFEELLSRYRDNLPDNIEVKKLRDAIARNIKELEAPCARYNKFQAIREEYTTLEADSGLNPLERKKKLEGLLHRCDGSDVSTRETGKFKSAVKSRIKELETQCDYYTRTRKFEEIASTLTSDTKNSLEERLKSLENLLAEYNTDDPFTGRDEELRDRLRIKISEWKAFLPLYDELSLLDKDYKNSYPPGKREVIEFIKRYETFLEKVKESSGDAAEKNRLCDLAGGKLESARADLCKLSSTVLNEKDGTRLVKIPAGNFKMGSSTQEIEAVIREREKAGKSSERKKYEVEMPQRMVFLDEYEIGQCEVTNQQFERFTGETGYRTEAEIEGWGYVYEKTADGKIKLAQRPGISWRSFSNQASVSHPVVMVSWKDANAYCEWAGMRLPTEAEWEKAARGKYGDVYPWGTNWSEGCLNYFKKESTGRANLFEGGGTVPIGSFPSGESPYGIMDMSGNVSEWCSDWYADNYEGLPASNPSGPSSGSYRVQRGGSWINTSPDSFRCAGRTSCLPNLRYYYTGFRCARSPRKTN